MKVNQLKLIIEGKEKQIEQINARMTLPVDQDILRMRIQKDLE